MSLCGQLRGPALMLPAACRRSGWAVEGPEQTDLRHSASTGERRQMPKPAADKLSESVTGLHL
jgi:hypothetical protein